MGNEHHLNQKFKSNSRYPSAPPAPPNSLTHISHPIPVNPADIYFPAPRALLASLTRSPLVPALLSSATLSASSFPPFALFAPPDHFSVALPTPIPLARAFLLLSTTPPASPLASLLPLAPLDVLAPPVPPASNCPYFLQFLLV